ncbi:MAG: arylsulfatase [Flammeovirgaceae bacterium]|nr:arylsulfatase [Flammeovirgaceae bacterium]
MKEKERIKYFFPVVFLLTLFSCDSQNTNKENVPNIILIMADDLGYETLGANGGTSYNTPNLDLMAESGIRFDHCYSQPVCTPSRVKIMTGINNIRNYVKFGYLDTGQTTFGHLLHEGDYATAIIGKWQLGKSASGPQHFGFDEHCLWQVTEGRIDSLGRDTRYSEPVLQINGLLQTLDKEDYGPDVVSQFGIKFMEFAVQKDQPFFLYYPMMLTHCPFSPTPDSKDWMVNEDAVFTYAGDSIYFKEMVNYMDKLVGRINEKLTELGIRDNTMIIFIGDNGTDQPIISNIGADKVFGGKGRSTNTGTHVPLIIQWPGVIKKGFSTNHLVDFSDFLPTICEAAGVLVPDKLDIDGKSFFPLITGNDQTTREPIYSWFKNNRKPFDVSVYARNQRFKLYDNGKFYDVKADPLEANSLNIEFLNHEAREAYELLRKSIISNGKRRLDAVSNQ